MKTPFLHLVKRLAAATPASWFPACLQEATGYVALRIEPALDAPAFAALQLAERAERLRPRHLAGCGALFAAPGYPPLGGVLVLPAQEGLSPVTAGDRVRALLLTRGRALLDAALADPRLLAHLDLGAPATSIAGAAGLQFLRDRHALSVGHFLRGTPAAAEGAAPPFDATSVCIQIAGLPPNLLLWLAAAIADEANAPLALVIGEDDDSVHRMERQRPVSAPVH